MATLYNKYRPQTFAEAVGQNHIKITLQNEIGAGQTAHAYLFCGPRAVGKTTFARLLAKAVNCTGRKKTDFEPCNKCPACNDITSGKSLDIIEIDAASNTGVDNVRENIIASARISPSREKYKIFIIDEVHMLSISAFNALLKVLEEPPKNVIFILCTTETHKVPATIISRCERFDFKRISLEDLVKKLSHIAREEKIKIDKEILEAIARQSEGHMRDAEGLLGQLVSIAGQEITRKEADLVIPRSAIGEIVHLLEILSKKDASGGIALINKLLEEGVDLEKFTDDFIEILRKVMLGKINPALGERLGLDIGESYEIKINELKGDLSAELLISFLEKFIAARLEMKNAFIVQLPLEIAIAELCLEIKTISKNNNPLPPLRQNTGGGANLSAPLSKPLSRPAAIPPAPKETIANINLDQAGIMSRWNEVLAKIKKYNHSLSFVLRVCQPRGISGNKICLAFKYKFHKDRIDEAKMREIVQTVFKEVYGSPLLIEAVIDEAMEIENGGGESNAELAKAPGEAVLETVSVEEISSLPEAEEPPLPVNDDIDIPAGNNNDVMSNFLKTFGGKIVG